MEKFFMSYLIYGLAESLNPEEAKRYGEYAERRAWTNALDKLLPLMERKEYYWYHNLYGRLERFDVPQESEDYEYSHRQVVLELLVKKPYTKNDI